MSEYKLEVSLPQIQCHRMGQLHRRYLGVEYLLYTYQQPSFTWDALLLHDMDFILPRTPSPECTKADADE